MPTLSETNITTDLVRTAMLACARDMDLLGLLIQQVNEIEVVTLVDDSLAEISHSLEQIKLEIYKSLSIDAVKEAEDIPSLCAALDELLAIDRDALGEVELPEFRDYGDLPEVDWGDFNSDCLAADHEYVLFRGQDGKLFYMSWEDVIDDG